MWRPAAALAFLLLANEALFGVASLARSPLTIDVGPSTGAYLTGFTESEERLPVTFRWTGERASVAPSVTVSPGPATLVIRYARFLDETVRVRVYVSGAQAGTFLARPGRFRTERLPITLPGGPLEIRLLSETTEPRRLGIAVDWIRLEQARSFLPFGTLGPRLLVLAVSLVSLWLGFGLKSSFGLGLALSIGQTLWFALDPFGLVHVSSRIAVASVLFTAACALVVRMLDRQPVRRWVPLIFLLGYLLKGAGIFYPSYFYPDVRNHRRYVYAFARAEGSIPERGLTAQMEVRTAYPRRIAGEQYALPYSPLFFIPFTWLPDDVHLVEDALKHVALVMGAAEALVVYVLATFLLGARVGLTASLLTVFLPPMYSRLFLAMWPTIAGHFLDCLAITAAVFWAARPERVARFAAFFGASLSSALIYISSLFNLSAFVASFALTERRLAVRALAAWALAALLTIVVLYSSFTLLFFREMAPTLLTSSEATAPGSLLEGMASVLSRVLLFYGYGFPALSIAGLALAYRRKDQAAFRMLTAYGVAFVLLTGLRVLPGGLFKDLKEILFVAPMVAICSGIALEELSRRGRSGQWSTVLILGGLVAFWWGSYRGYWVAYASLAGLD